MSNYMKTLLFLVIGFLVWSCGSDQPKMEEYDLLKHGIPMTIQLPIDSPIVKTAEGFLGDKEVTIKGGEGYDLLISYAPAATSDMAELKAEVLKNVKDISNFSKIVKEEEAGFIYETAIDSVNMYYGFRYIRLQGDQRYLFQSGLVGTFSQEEAEMMYESVKPLSK